MGQNTLLYSRENEHSCTNSRIEGGGGGRGSWSRLLNYDEA